MKVLLVDDHPLFIEGLRNILNSRDIEVVGTAPNGLEALEKAGTLQPDVIKIVMLTVSEELFNMLEALNKGEAPLSPGLALRVFKDYNDEVLPGKGKEEEENEILTQRQMEVLSLVAQGKTYKEVAESLYVTERTVKYHMGKIIEKLHLKNRAQVIAYASQVFRYRVQKLLSMRQGAVL